MVLAAEVGRRSSNETAQFLSALAEARSQSVPLILQGRAKAAWLRRWSAMLACSAARAFAVSLLDRRLSQVWEVIRLQCMRCWGRTGFRCQFLL